ncbi:MAG: TolC family protein [Spirosomaceae bacterium]|nr:TolC family protein [Spirosomataceae bacterium]
MKVKQLLFTIGLLLGVIPLLQAQQAFSIKEAVIYAQKNNPNVKTSELDINGADLRIREIKAAGMPQVAGNFSFTSNIIVPTVVLPASTFNPQAPEGEIVKAKFGVPWGGQAGVGLNQLVFDASWLVGLKAAGVYRELAQRNLKQSKVTVAENVIKAYYSVLVAEERAKILDLNVSRLDSLVREMKIMNQQGFIEKIDIDRLEVQRNNLLTERQKVSNLIQLTYQLLKFNMGYGLQNTLTLKDKLTDVDLVALKLIDNQTVDYGNRIEYQVLQSQRRLTELDIESKQKGSLPKVFGQASLAANHGNQRFNPFERWFPTSAVTLGLQIPIYDSGLRNIQVQQSKLNLAKIDLGATAMRQGFDLQLDQAMINLKNGLQTLETQQRNLDLAKEVLRVSKIKYQGGIGSNLEVVNAESSIKEAQTNYFAALYDVIIAKVDLDKAQGKLELE